ncbi:MAG: glycerate kinase [Saprospiraceae bacterium]
MKILLAPDKFKGSISALEVCHAIENGLLKQAKSFEVTAHPMADGGDGSLAILSKYLNLDTQNIQTLDPLGREIQALYYTSSTAAFIEVASASGLVLLNKKERDPLKTSTLGTGKMIVDALSKGYKQIYLFLGGSATNDAGIGIASALGYQFLGKQKNILNPIGENLSKINHLRSSSQFDFKNIKLTLLCDVTNPLFGTNGAAYVYAPQKGASAKEVAYLDAGLRHFSQLINHQLGKDVSRIPGSGAAGGIGAGLIGLLNAQIEAGFDVIAKLTGLEQKIQWADWVISGEGKLDTQSLQGKVIDGVAKLCKKHKKPLTLLVGKNDLKHQNLDHLNINDVFSIYEQAKDLDDAMRNGVSYLEEMAQKITFQL